MTLLEYEPEIHLEMAKTLIEARALNPSYLEDLPHVGAVVFDWEQVIAMAFIRIVEGSFALFDGFITNPNQLPDFRSRALDLLTEYLIEKAKKMGLKKIIAFSNNANILERARRHGFVDVDLSLIALNLSKDDHLCHF